MATTTSLPKSDHHSPQNFSWKLLTAIVMWIVLTLGLIFAVYAQSVQNSHQISYLMSEMRNQDSTLHELRSDTNTLEMNVRNAIENQDRTTKGSLAEMQSDLNNHQASMRKSLEKYEKDFSQLSEKLNEKESESNVQGDLQSIQKQVEQMKDSFHSYIKSEDFFQVVNNMMDVYSKKFNQIYQELEEKDQVIQKLLEARNDLILLQGGSRMKGENFRGENVLSDENIEIPETASEETESFIHQVEASIEDLKSKISHGMDETLEVMKDLTTSAQEKLEPVKELIVNSAGDSMNKVKELAQSTKEKLKGLINIRDESPFERVKEFAKSTGENLGAIKDFVVSNAGQSAEKIKEISKTATEKIGPLKSAVSEKAQNVKDGVQKIGKNLGEKTKEIAEKAKNFAKKFF